MAKLTIRRFITKLGVVLCALLMSVPYSLAQAQDDEDIFKQGEQPVAIENLPAPVRAGMEKAAPGVFWQTATVRLYRDIPTYTVRGKQFRDAWILIMRRDGKLIYSNKDRQ